MPLKECRMYLFLQSKVSLKIGILSKKILVKGTDEEQLDFLLASPKWFFSKADSSDRSRSKIFDPGWVIFCWSRWDRSATQWFGKFPCRKYHIFKFFTLWVRKYDWVRPINTWVKDGSASYLQRVKSMVRSHL